MQTSFLTPAIMARQACRLIYAGHTLALDWQGAAAPYFVLTNSPSGINYMTENQGIEV